MYIIQRRGLLIVSCFLALTVATGCFQAAGDTLQATGIAQGIALFTPTPSPTLDLLPTETDEEPSPSPDDLNLFATETPASAASALEQDAFQIQEIDPVNLTSTAIVARATQTIEAILTTTAEAMITQYVPTATETPWQMETPTPQPIISGGNCVHVVQQSDRNLWQISQLYGITVHEIAAASGISNIQLIVVGQNLTIPGCGVTGYRQPQSGIITDGQGGGGAISSSGRYHTVRQNETLARIAAQYGTTVSQLAALNGISNANLIYIDQQIALP